MNPDTSDDTAELVRLSELLTLARLGVAMRKAQRAYFTRRKALPMDPATAEYRAARDAEQRFDAAAAAALNRQRQSLPGMGSEEVGGGPA